MRGELRMNSEIRTAHKWYWWLWLSPLLTIPTLGLLIMLSWLFCNEFWSGCYHPRNDLITGMVAVFGSALWHLILLVPALNQQSAFVRWHGRQALLLAGIRTVVPAAFVLFHFGIVEDSEGVLWVIPIMIAFWFFGALWGQRQAARGDCWLMRWAGKGAGLPLMDEAVTSAATQNLNPKNQDVEDGDFTHDPSPGPRSGSRREEAVQVVHTLPISGIAPEVKERVVPELKQIHRADENLAVDELVAIFRFSPDPEERRLALAKLERLGLVKTL
jgi:hypothetical protein